MSATTLTPARIEGYDAILPLSLDYDGDPFHAFSLPLPGGVDPDTVDGFDTPDGLHAQLLDGQIAIVIDADAFDFAPLDENRLRNGRPIADFTLRYREGKAKAKRRMRLAIEPSLSDATGQLKDARWLLIDTAAVGLDIGASGGRLLYRSAADDTPRLLEELRPPFFLAPRASLVLVGKDARRALRRGRAGLFERLKRAFRAGSFEFRDEQGYLVKVPRYDLARLALDRFARRFVRTLFVVTYPVNETDLEALDIRIRALVEHGHTVYLLRESEALAIAACVEVPAIRDRDGDVLVFAIDPGYFTLDLVLIGIDGAGLVTTERMASTGDRFGSYNKELAVLASLLHLFAAHGLEDLPLGPNESATYERLLGLLRQAHPGDRLHSAMEFVRALYLHAYVKGYAGPDTRIDDLRHFEEEFGSLAGLDIPDIEHHLADIAAPASDSMFRRCIERQVRIIRHFYAECRTATVATIVPVMGGGDGLCQPLLDALAADPDLPPIHLLADPREATARGAFAASTFLAMPQPAMRIATISERDECRLLQTVGYPVAATLHVVIGRAGERLATVNDRLRRGLAAPDATGTSQPLTLHITTGSSQLSLYRTFYPTTEIPDERQHMGVLRFAEERFRGRTLLLQLDEAGLPTATAVRPDDPDDSIPVPFSPTDYIGG